MRSPQPDPHRVVALVLPGVITFDLAIAAQAFGHQEQAHLYRFAVCTPRPGRVATQSPFAIDVECGLAELEQADTIIVPGYRPLVAPPQPVLDALRSAHARGARIASVCVGAFALAATGLLDGHVATTHWREAAEFRRRFPAVRLNPGVLYVDNGQLLTSAGLSAGIDLCLHMIRQDHGAAAASRVARHMVVAAHRPGGQAQFASQVSEDDGLSATFGWMVGEMHRPLTVAQMARHAGMPERSFARKFRARTDMTPMRWLATQRLLEAQRLLESTPLPVEDIAERTGLGTAANLRLHMARQLGTTPTAYRKLRAAGEPLSAS
ncbi:GlxA family transcriptional regulator [Amycolatopsis sp. cmx-4-61]|uniref:GlxA family transcriptional regulator n=1 Tax=Amycolatopsis sp. cmx-4-61 TaxID=2790937 RepID=UPI00397B0061